MASLVLDLQKKACDGNVSVSELLRHAIVVAKKTGSVEIESWLKNESDGYKRFEDIPEYRILNAKPYMVDERNSNLKTLLDCDDQDLMKKLIIHPRFDSISCLEKVSTDLKGPIASFQPPLHNEKILRLIFKSDRPINFSFETPSIEITGIFNKVRNLILNWGLELEEEGVRGENWSFSGKEKELSKQASITIINNYTVTIHSSSEAAIQIGSNGAHQNFYCNKDKGLKILLDLKNFFNNSDVSDEIKNEAQSLIDELKTEISSSTLTNTKLGDFMSKIKTSAQKLPKKRWILV